MPLRKLTEAPSGAFSLSRAPRASRQLQRPAGSAHWLVGVSQQYVGSFEAPLLGFSTALGGSQKLLGNSQWPCGSPQK
eukprot:2478894-Pyramimonas_sp.AAC.1